MRSTGVLGARRPRVAGAPRERLEAGPFTRSPADRWVMAMVSGQRLPVVGPVLRQLLKLAGTDIPPQTLTGCRGLVLQHGGRVCVHWATEIGDDVVLMQNVTVGRGDLWRRPSPGAHVVLEDDVILGAGAVVLFSRETVVVGRGTVVGANAVLTCSTGEMEIWAGAPARRVGTRTAGA